ncbi:MAG: DUF4421 family protein [Muribaculaceae bacterium]|nr:DUF4421 family protein [Muribaculaceae bacterium]MBP5315074.1 DUF4421 family protein [Muribaculaceae bacterium]
MSKTTPHSRFVIMKHFVYDSLRAFLTVVAIAFAALWASADTVEGDTIVAPAEAADIQVAADSINKHFDGWIDPDTITGSLAFFKRLKARAQNKINEPYDTTRDDRYWWRAMKHGKVDFDDPTMGYPKFLRFCYKAYLWADSNFNYHDPEYVVSTGTLCKAMLKFNNWFDSYLCYSLEDTDIAIRSNMTTNIGVQVSVMGLSFSYSFDLGDIFEKSRSKKIDFGFSCARFSLNLNYIKNSSPVVVRKFGNYQGEKVVRDVEGFNRKNLKVSGYYFLNYKRYSQDAPYSFTEYQRKSAGSFIFGLSYDHLNLDIDKEHFDEYTIINLPWQLLFGKIKQDDYCVMAGYGYNWVLPHNWLFNVTAIPYAGLKKTYQTIHEDNPYMFSANALLKLGAAYNHRSLYVGINASVDAHGYRSYGTNCHTSIEDIYLVAGVRF